MPFRIERNDITLVHSDAIVNTANPQPTIGSGTDSAVYTAAGAEQLLEARKAIGKIPRGQARHTPAYNLSRNGVQHIIHTVGITYKYNELLCQHKKIHRFKVYKLYSLFVFQFIALEGVIHFIRYTVI